MYLCGVNLKFILKMKKILLFAVLFVAFLSCSRSSDNSEDLPREDFTNTDYIKKIMVGTWDYKASKFSISEYWKNEYNLPGLEPYESYYIINADGTYIYKPYKPVNDDTYNETGTYVITPVKDGYKAYIEFKEKNGGGTQKLYLDNYENNVVEAHSNTIISPTGVIYYKYQKR